MKKILITGGHGFIGTHLTNYLESLGHDVWTVDVDKPKTKRTKSFEMNIVYHQSELFSEHTFDVIFHLAAQPRMGFGVENPEFVIRNNVNSLVTVLGFCRENPDTQLIFTSSSSTVWSDYRKSPYTMSKLLCEQIIHTYRETYDLKASTVRLYNVYGPGEADYGKHSTLLKQCKRAYLNQETFKIFGDGNCSRDFTHVQDVVEGLAAIIDKNHESYDLGFGSTLPVRSIVNSFANHGMKVEHAEARPWDAPYTKSDIAAWPAGWKPKTAVLDYIENWFTEGCPND